MTTVQFADAYRDGFARTIRFILSKGLNHSEAEEIAQTAWARGWERRAQLHDLKALPAWINTIALNMLRNVVRRRKREVTFEGYYFPSSRPAGTAARLDLQRMLSSCNPLDQTLFRLRHFEGLTTPEAARRCGLSAVTARVRLMRARRRIRMNWDTGGSSLPYGPGTHERPWKRPTRTRQSRDY